MADLTFQWEPLIRLLTRDNLAPITDEHWAAIALDQEAVPLVVDWELYLSQERAGTWRAFTARRGGALVGYIAFNFYKPTRYRTTLFIHEDTIWVVPSEKNRALVWRALWREAIAVIDHERQGTVVKLQGKIRLTRDEAKMLTGSLGRRFFGRLLFMMAGRVLLSLGLKPIEVVFSTVLK